MPQLVPVSGFEEEEDDDTKDREIAYKLSVFSPEESKVGINTWGLYS